MKVWFGKYKGKNFCEVPKGYWRWMKQQPGINKRLGIIIDVVLAGGDPDKLEFKTIEEQVEEICQPWEPN